MQRTDALTGVRSGAVVRSARWALLMMGVATLAGCSSSGSVKTTPPSQSSSKTTTASSWARLRGPVTFRPVLWNGTGQPMPSASGDSETRAEAALSALDCTHPDKAPPAAGPEYLAACSRDGKTKYLLGPSALSGARVHTAVAVSMDGNWRVDVTLHSEGSTQFADLTSSPSQTGPQLALPGGAPPRAAPPRPEPMPAAQGEGPGGP